MSVKDVFEKLRAALDSAGIPYFVTERQINDAAGIIQVQAEKLDLEYVERWVAVLELDEQLAAARERAGES